MMDPVQYERYSRQILFAPLGEEGQRRLLESRAVLVGCGALGTVLAGLLSEVQESGFDLEGTHENLGVDTREVVTAPTDLQVPESQIGAVECAQMIVREEGIAFNALLRHTDIYVTTAEISKQVFESVGSGSSVSG